MLKKEQQAYAYDEGYFYPGPAVKDVPLSMAPQASQEAIREYGRPEYEKLIADNPKELPLEPEQLVQAFRRWDEEIGSKKQLTLGACPIVSGRRIRYRDCSVFALALLQPRRSS